MKKPEIQIVAMLKAFSKKDIEKAIHLYQNEIKLKTKLVKEGWECQSTKPTDKEFYYIDNMYWVQKGENKQSEINRTQGNPSNRKTDVSLKSTDIKCPLCRSKMYKQKVCGGCKEGRNGYKIRLICEENPDHEILL